MLFNIKKNTKHERVQITQCKHTISLHTICTTWQNKYGEWYEAIQISTFYTLNVINQLMIRRYARIQIDIHTVT